MRPAAEPPTDSPGDGRRTADADPAQVARTIALRRLTAAPRSCAQLRADLLARGVAPDVADEVVERFTEVGLLDDVEFARMWVDSRRRTRGAARPVLRRELRDRGIDEDIVTAALADLDADAERARAVELVRARSAKLTATPSRASRVTGADSAAPTPDRRHRLLVGYLVRRGYATGQAHDVVREVLGEVDSA